MFLSSPSPPAPEGWDKDHTQHQHILVANTALVLYISLHLFTLFISFSLVILSTLLSYLLPILILALST